jgi:tetratricopeptide (TPR) repeat protein
LTGALVQFPWRPNRLTRADSRPAAERALETPIAERSDQARALGLHDPELLLCVGEILRTRIDGAPATVREDAVFFYDFIEAAQEPVGLHDEKEYFLGEFALTVATCARILFRIEEAKSWLQRAEANFALTHNANVHWARVAYQRMALAVEERRFEEVLNLGPRWAQTFARLDMPEESLKCRFLEGAVRWELGEFSKAIEINKSICQQAEQIGSKRLLSQAVGNLVRYFAVTGETDEALACARKALPILREVGDRIHFVKLQWSMGDLLRKQGQRAIAVETYRQAQTEARDLGLRGDLAALHLVIADLLIEAGQEAQAEWEIRAALPIIDEEKMVPEGIAALSLLRESLRRRQIDKQALRELHGYFQEK